MEMLSELLGESPAIETVRENIRRILGRQHGGRRMPAILLHGETGAGKGLVARLIHKQGPRASQPFVDVNCAAIPETLLEAELFGFERGAFTDARRAKPGLFQTAHRGTIFLDEVGLLPEGLQAKLLKVIEEGAVRRLGSTHSEPADVWIISATNSDLSSASREHHFREDLYHRLAVLTLRLPPLRERGRDIVLLANHFLARACDDYGLPRRVLSPSAEACLLAYAWPGNIRELFNVIERVALLAEAPVVTADMLQLPEPAPAASPSPHSALGSLDDAMRLHLAAALEQTGWNISRTASLLGISRNTVRARMRKCGLHTETRSPVLPPKTKPTTSPAPLPTALPPPAAASPATFRWGTRRITLLRATLLAVDDADVTSDLSRALELLVDKVQSFGGHIEELSQHGVGAAFGLDQAEDAPRRAAHAAMAIQRAIERVRPGEGQRLTVKIGIHAGEVLIGQSADRTEIDADAKRALWSELDALLARAEENGIIASAPVAQFLERRFSLAHQGTAGSGSDVAYLVPGRERPGLSPEGHMAAFVGRRQELALLRSRLESARMGHGQIVGIVGEAGIGKSRLLYEFRQSLRGERVIYLEGHCLSHGTGMAYLPVLQIVRHAWRLMDGDTPTRLTHKVRAGLERLQMDPAASLPYLLHFLGVKGDLVELSLLSPETVQTRTIEILRQLCIYASRQRPLVIAVEDVHWIDEASKALGAMVEGLAVFRLLVILTCRAGYQPLWADTSHMTQIALQPLNPEDSLSILGDLLPPAAAPDSVTQMILSKAEGNPFFLEELARIVREQGGLSSSITVPDTVQDVLLARINRLADRDRQVLQSASVIGKAVALDVLQAIVDVPEPLLMTSLAELRAGDFLHDSTSGPETEYSFKHALTHEVAYGSLEPRQRRELHARIARAIEELHPERCRDDPTVPGAHD